MSDTNPPCTDVLESTVHWFECAIDQPDESRIRPQFCAHLEEFNELLNELQTNDVDLLHLVSGAKHQLAAIQSHLNSTVKPSISFPDRVATLDAICDGLVTGAGLAYMLKMDVVSALNEVNRSNFSKFDADNKPIFNLSGKIMKGENYSRPDLTNYV